MSKLLTTVLLFSIAIAAHGQNNAAVKEYLGVPGPIVLNKESFGLVWSSHPSGNYYKQEYLGAKDVLEKFKRMVMVEVLAGEAKAADLAKAKLAELQRMKQGNPMVNYEMFQKNGEIIIDFLLSENAADGKRVNIIERNVYRYKDITDKKGKKGVMLFAVSERGYGNEVDGFLAGLKKDKPSLLNAVAAYPVPSLDIKN